MEDFKSIIVSSGKKGVTVLKNPTSYPMIGKGKQGAVFKIAPDRCVKMFADEGRCRNESKVLKAAQGARIVPQLFETGSNYIVMEYMDGPTLDQYLEPMGTVPEEITKKILFLFKEMKRVGFTRIDARLRHIFMTKEDELIVIDHANSFIKTEQKPLGLFKDLKKLGLLSSFLNQVKQLEPDLFYEWKDFEKKKKK